MKIFKYGILICFLTILTGLQAESQTPSFFQMTDISKYQEKKFTFTGWFHADQINNHSLAVVMAITFKKENKQKREVLDRFIEKAGKVKYKPGDWTKLTISGKINQQANRMAVGVGYFADGKFYFDDMQLTIKSRNNEIEIPLNNAGFEQSDTAPWKFNNTPENVKISLSNEWVHSGKQALCIENLGEQSEKDNSTDRSDKTTGHKTEKPKALLDKMVHIFQTQSIYKDSVNWDALKLKLYKSIDYSALNSEEAIIPAYVQLSKILGITHGGLNYKGENYGALNRGLSKMSNRISKEVNEAAKNEKYIFRTKILDKRFGYISIPHVGIQYSKDMNMMKRELTKKASIIQDSLCKLSGAGLKGIIIDLRLNNGGSTVAMMAGLTSLYKQGLLYSNVMANGTQEKVVKSGKYLLFDQDTLVNLKPQCPALNKIKVAVLISPYTASAAEQTAILLAGRNHTIVIGEKTKGQTSGIQTIRLAKELTLDVATGYSSNRQGKIYLDGISPDIKVVGGDDFANLSKDKKVEAAIKWLKSQD